jgi:FtsZ-interacting cell division protein ZipA
VNWRQGTGRTVGIVGVFLLLFFLFLFLFIKRHVRLRIPDIYPFSEHAKRKQTPGQNQTHETKSNTKCTSQAKNQTHNTQKAKPPDGRGPPASRARCRRSQSVHMHKTSQRPEHAVPNPQPTNAKSQIHTKPQSPKSPIRPPPQKKAKKSTDITTHPCRVSPTSCGWRRRHRRRSP